jgi:hypothetical protein
VNEAVQVYYRVEDHTEGQFVCECSDATCVGKVFLRPVEYADIREHPTRFFVLPGHEVVGVERVVEENDGFSVVEKPVVP